MGSVVTELVTFCPELNVPAGYLSVTSRFHIVHHEVESQPSPELT